MHWDIRSMWFVFNYYDHYNTAEFFRPETNVWRKLLGSCENSWKLQFPEY